MLAVFRVPSAGFLLGPILALASGGCFSGPSGSCDPFDPPPPIRQPYVETGVDGQMSLSDGGTLHAATFNAPRQPAGFACFASIGGSPDAQVVSFTCDEQERPTSNPGLSSFDARIEYGPVDLRSVAVGNSTVPIKVRITGSGGWCEASTNGSITIVDAKGAAAPDPKFASDDYLRSGTITLDLDTMSIEGWTAEAGWPECSSRPSVMAHLTASFEQLPRDFKVDERPSCQLSSK